MRRRIALVVLMAWLGFLLAFAFTLPDARAGIRREPPGATEHGVPLAWIAEALAQMPFLIPAAR
jgi:hypothetical protein